MDGGDQIISHRTLEVNGIRMHVAEAGDEGAPAVILLHGFPELWYGWRHQIAGLAARGYRAVAPDLRGYGGTDAPPDAASYSCFHLVGDIVALIDALGQQQVFVVGHDWGAMLAWYLCMFRPDKVKALVNLSIHFIPRDPAVKMVDGFRAIYGDDIYICRFQDPGEPEADIAKVDTASFFRWILSKKSTGANFVPRAEEILRDPPAALPPWLSEEDVDYFASQFDKTGFTGGINYYRCINLNWELTAAWTGHQIKVPVKYIVGDMDLAYHFTGAQEYIHEGGFARDVPLLEDVVVVKGAGHFIQQEMPEEITEHIHEFIRKF